MTLHLRFPLIRLALITIFAALVLAAPAHAQTMAPAASPAAASADAVSADSNPSPLGPYLVLVVWLLPISGILTVVAGIYVDRTLRARDPRRKLR